MPLKIGELTYCEHCERPLTQPTVCRECIEEWTKPLRGLPGLRLVDDDAGRKTLIGRRVFHAKGAAIVKAVFPLPCRNPDTGESLNDWEVIVEFENYEIGENFATVQASSLSLHPEGWP